MTPRFVSVATLGLISAFTAMASAIPVVNFSFETVVGSLPVGCGTGCSFSTGAIPGWSGVDAHSGQFQPGTQAANFAYFTTLSDGITSAYSNGASIVQTVLPTVQVGVIYTLMVDLGHRNDLPFKAAADLLINGIRTTAGGLVPTPGNWSTFTASYIGLAGDVGKSITIELTSSGLQANFDNVRLSDSTPNLASAAPEPADITLLGLGLVGLSVLARRKRAS